MDKRIKKIAAAMGLSGAVILSSPAAAQSAEETINVGVDVQIAQPPVQIIRLDDINISYDPELNTSGSVMGSDFFCLYVPDGGDVTLETIGTNIYAPDEELLALTESQTGELKQLSYRLIINVLTSDGPVGHLINSGNRVNSASFPTLALLFNEEDCGGSENMEVQVSVIDLNDSSPAIPNTAVINSLPPGSIYNFSDQLTVIITPVI